MNRLRRWKSTRKLNKDKTDNDDNIDENINDTDNTRIYNRSKSYPELELSNKLDYKKRCQICKINKADYVRVFDHTSLPAEYFYPPEENFELMIEKIKDMNNVSFYPDCWIHLPMDKILTRYDTRYCKECYDKCEKLDEWNYWIDFVN